jgi:hypothetical protein
MDYKKIYDDLMRARLSIKNDRIKQKGEGAYLERHHIIPLSMGGIKSYSLGSDNIVLLTAREHYLAHRMLWLIYKTREMGFAFHKMVFSSSPLQKRIFDSRAYEAAKKALSECQRGVNNPMYGKESPMKGKSCVNKGKKLGPRPYQIGENNPSKREESRKKISEKLKGREREKIRGVKNSNFGGMKILLKDDQIIGTFERIEEMLEFVPTSIFNLRNHLRSRRGGLICGHWRIFYVNDYQKESPE